MSQGQFMNDHELEKFMNIHERSLNVFKSSRALFMKLKLFTNTKVTALCSEGSMFRRSYVQKIFVQKVLYS